MSRVAGTPHSGQTCGSSRSRMLRMAVKAPQLSQLYS